jgi:tryptophan synthase alpha subunit
MERTLRMRVAQIKANENAARAASDSADGAAVGSATADPAGD